MFVLLSSTEIVFFIAVVHVVSLLWQLYVSIDYNGKSGSRPLFLSDFRYFNKSFTVMVLE